MHSDHQTWIYNSINDFRKNANDFAIFIVASIKDITQCKDDYLGYSVHNEYMTEQSIRGFVDQAQYCGAYVQLFNGENDFIQFVLDGRFDRIQKAKKVVYSLAASGTGPARKSLIPCFCNLNGIPCCNSNGEAVALSRHKYHATALLRSHGIPVPRSWYLSQSNEWLQNNAPILGGKVIIKPIYESACIGLDSDCVRIWDDEAAKFANEHSKRMRQGLIVQEFVSGFEVDVPVFSAPNIYAPMAVGISFNSKRKLDEDFLQYEILSKSTFGFYRFEEECPDLASEICGVAQDAAKILDIIGCGRIDFRVSSQGEYFVIDFQTLPDINDHSSVNYALQEEFAESAKTYIIILAINLKRLNLT